MSGVVDVGDGFELTFNSAPGATVDVLWFNPDQEIVLQQVAAESPPGSGKYPYTLIADVPGVWTARFTASGTATQQENYYVRARAIDGPIPLAVVGDVIEQYGTMTAAQEGLVSGLLRAASSLVRSRFAVDAAITAGRLDADVVALGVTNMILRVLRNPGGLRSETVGPFSRTYDTSAAAGLLIITAAEESMFTPAPQVPVSPVGTIALGVGLAPPGRRSRGWCW